MKQSKGQLACEAALEWDKESMQSQARMRQGKRTDLNECPDVEFGQTREILSKKYGVSNSYVQIARNLFLEDRELFELVRLGQESFPYVKSKRKPNEISYALYRAFNEKEELLYIGKTLSVGQRMESHAKYSDWWDEFSFMTVQRGFSSQEDLIQAEELAIKLEKPLYNKIFN